MENIDVFIMDPTFIDLLVYDLWLQGFSENEAAQRRKCDEKFKNFGASHAIITSDTQDQFRLFYMLERFLQSPPMLAKQMLLQISPDVQDILIERYYQFDKEVVRELLGKKLTGRVRKDLDDVSEKTNIPLKSCRRQEHSTMTLLCLEYRPVNQQSSIQYACICFMAINKIETGKKRLSYLSFDDLVFCAEQMLDHWTVGSVEGSTADVGDTGAEFDRGFLQELRDLKVFVNDKEIVDEHRSLVCNDIAKRFTKKLAKSVENNFKNLCRGLLTIAAGLIHSKEVKDVLSDFVEKFIESCKQQEWDANETDIFLGSLVDTCGKLDSLHRSNLERLIPVYSRYMTVCQKCIVRMYHD
ncbi:acidic fibroblast growth factor intracellular-binding protein-like [Pocillopora damicornis]|uniref:acidic fibroblast growth factor intracellular-binding protein-like n=1 Tax=Pocillopora damicornis TaxID=46731 RepID=UPI000F5518C3|nr:acidic fibroblast growth factor intracellular-binding protein-like [Pocillopora damicornis]